VLHLVFTICFRLREQAYNWVNKGQRLHVTGRIIYGEVNIFLKIMCYENCFFVRLVWSFSSSSTLKNKQVSHDFDFIFLKQ
jgi:hypothetical protein